MPVRYLPMIKTKAGEITALTNLAAATKDRVLPVFHVTSTVTPNFARALGNAWSARLLTVDGSFSFNTTGNINTFTSVLGGIRQHGARAYPSVSIDAPAALRSAAAGLVNNEGVMVRTPLASLGAVQTWLAAQGWQAGDVDLVIDVGHIAALPINLLAQMVGTAIHTSIGAVSPYRSVTMSAASAPKDHGELPRGRSNVPRLDWALWQQVSPQIPFQLDYGDYCTGHPDLTEPPGVAMASATVSARYAGASNWLVIKGHSTGGAQGQPMAQQYAGHAEHYVADPEFGGLPHCWADGRISAIQAGTATSGNRRSWSEIALNRHIEIVVSQLP